MTNRVTTNRVCAAPGCTRFLKARWPHPDCPACRGEAEPPPQARPGTRTLQVTYAASHSGVSPTVAITLPAEPWHSPERTPA